MVNNAIVVLCSSLAHCPDFRIRAWLAIHGGSRAPGKLGWVGQGFFFLFLSPLAGDISVLDRARKNKRETTTNTALEEKNIEAAMGGRRGEGSLFIWPPAAPKDDDEHDFSHW